MMLTSALVWFQLFLPSQPQPTVHPAVWDQLSREQSVTVWLWLQDKHPSDDHALHQVESSLNPLARQRRQRRRVLPGVVDHRDLPLDAAAVAAIRRTRCTLRTQSPWLNAVSVTADARQLSALMHLPRIKSIEPVRRSRRCEAVPVVGQRTARRAARRAQGGWYGLSQQQLDQIDVITMHQAGYTGSGVVIGILDTGFVRSHAAFNNPLHPLQVISEHDFINDDGNTGIEAGDPENQHRHGTLILGTLAAYDPGNLIGSAYNASFVLAKTEDTADEYETEEDYYVAGLEFLEAQGADIATSSLGYYDWYTWEDMDGITAVTTLAVNLATANGMVCCTAAGNRGSDSDLPSLIAPGDALEVLTVGAVDANGWLADFSSNGPTFDMRVKPEVLARGVDTHTVDPAADDNYISANGTSLSTPLVAGAVALLLEAHPDWSILQIRDALFQSADYFVEHGTFDPEYRQGYGIIDIAAAAMISLCTADFNQDNGVDASDLAVLLGAWGPGAGNPADLNLDDVVDAADLAALLGQWGDCALTP